MLVKSKNYHVLRHGIIVAFTFSVLLSNRNIIKCIDDGLCWRWCVRSAELLLRLTSTQLHRASLWIPLGNSVLEVPVFFTVRALRKRHFLEGFCIVTYISRQNRTSGLTCKCVQEKIHSRHVSLASIWKNARHLGFSSGMSCGLYKILSLEISVPNLVLASQFAQFFFFRSTRSCQLPAMSRFSPISLCLS